MDEKITQALDERRGEAQALLERLTRQPSVAAQNKGISEMAALVEGLLKEAGFEEIQQLEDRFLMIGFVRATKPKELH